MTCREQPLRPNIHALEYVRPKRDFEVVAKQNFVDPTVYPCFEIYPGHISDREDSVVTGEGTSQQSVHTRFDACEPTAFLFAALLSDISKPGSIPVLRYIRHRPPHESRHTYASFGQAVRSVPCVQPV
jgi:hypothetical protein